MVCSVKSAITAVLVYAIYLTAAVSLDEFSTSLGADSWFADVVLTKVNYYRALCDADPVTYDDGDAFQAQVDATNCSLLYDYWSGYGQIIFRMGREDNQDVDIVNSTYFAIDHWYDLRSSYRPTEDDYDELQPFWGSWEFTQMVWKSNTKVGCAWQNTGECPITDEDNADGLPISRFKQLLCYFTPGGNKWDQFGLQVSCPDCNAPPQTSTVSVPTTLIERDEYPTGRQYGLATPASGASTPFNKVYWDVELQRVEAARSMHATDFLPPRLMSMSKSKPVSSMTISSDIRPTHAAESGTTRANFATSPGHPHARPISPRSATIMGPDNVLAIDSTHRSDSNPSSTPPLSMVDPTASSPPLPQENGPTV